jgi:hypothetical protein
MKIRETFDAVQWFPDQPHPAVETSVLGSGMSRNLHQDIAQQLEAGNGQVGAIFMMMPNKQRMWLMVYPGDWIITRPGPIYELVRQAEFAKRYEVI